MSETRIDLSTWLTKQEAADRIGVSTKAIERFTRAGKLEQRFRPQAGSPHVAVFYPQEVDELAARRRQAPAPFVLEASTDRPTNGNGHGGLAHTKDPQGIYKDLDDPLRAFAVAVVAAVMSQTSQTAVSQTPAYVDQAEALAIAGVSVEQLRAAVKAGEVKQRGRRYRVQDLEQL